jgi:hypothetical protein
MTNSVVPHPVGLFLPHYFENGFIGFHHAVGAEDSHILNGLFRAIADNAVGILDIDSLQG